MARRFVNPHFLPESSVSVSRKDIYAEENESPGREENLQPDPKLFNHLHDLIRKSLETDLPDVLRNRKRRKIQVEELADHEPAPIPFRLVSSAQQPHLIFLHPKPPPPPITREPEVEDSEEQAVLRLERAQAAAVEASSVFEESQIILPPLPWDARRLVSATATLPTSSPALMIIEHDKPSRSTRPPVPESYLRHHPYHNGPIGLTSTSYRARCPVIPASFDTLNKSVMSTKRKRKRGKMARIERPPPAFWRPNPAVGGKSLGYAMGFPCSVEVLLNGSDESSQYQRDTMRKCVLS
ncbi:hypothetical protein H0H81_009538 [Sphagnurus paluster]|uniref:Uncharacterized protein n=1 Tax=Sphagnurus paluster TaxID=117069 RepID=A0A9P7K4C0_9AGAR|nr:hypothetical protein H0H81_009538 [Sphagnurus paluster]